MNASGTDLVHLIVWYASARGEVLTAVRVVKFLYLADLYYARAHSGRTMTDWPWAFVHFGPYCSESMEALDEAVKGSLIEAKPYTSRYTDEEKFVFRCDVEDVPALESQLPNSVALPLRRAVHYWAGDTSALLDHVYFETEPMIPAKRGERLDFTLASPPPPPYTSAETAKLSKSRIREGRRLVERLRARVEEELRRQGSAWPTAETDPALKDVLQGHEHEKPPENLTARATLGRLNPEADEDE